MAHFILVSGSEGVLEHWQPCVQVLRSHGHGATAFSWSCLPWQHGPEGVVAFLEEHAAHATAPVLVGHSAGGLLVPRVRRGVRAEIYLAALAPQPGLSFSEQMFESPTEVFDPAWLASAYAPHSPEAAILRRLYDTPFTAFAGRPRLYIPYLQDREIRPQWQQWVAREVLKAEVRPLCGGHYAHVTQAAEICAALMAFAG